MGASPNRPAISIGEDENEMSYLALTDEELSSLLNDDVPCGDLTTETSRIGQQAARLEFRARQEMVVCGIEEASRLFTLNDAKVAVQVHSGQKVSKDTLLLEAQSSAQILHRVWKTAQVLVEWASGISTSSAAIVSAASPVALACTRKNVPGTKALSIKAVRAGGAIMHRLGLSETLLLFPEHLIYLDESPGETIARIRHAEPEKKMVVEVANVGQAIVWAKAGAEVLQLEKFIPEAVAECRSALDRAGLKTILAAAGGIRADNAAAYVRAGADLLVTSAPYSAPPKDVQVTFYK
jgi:molybdenum transport protein